MSAQAKVEVTVYCDGASHFPLTFALPFPTTKGAINSEIDSRGWIRLAGGKTVCREHRGTVRK